MNLFLYAGVAVLLVVALVRSQLIAAKRSRRTWEDLIAALEPVETEGIAFAALEHLDPQKFRINSQIGTEPSELYRMIGAADGLWKMRSNAGILIALAAHAQSWNLEESRVVAERMRRDALMLRRAVFRIALSLTLGLGKTRSAFYLHEAASAYYLMRRRLLLLYETSHAGRYPELARAI